LFLIYVIPIYSDSTVDIRESPVYVRAGFNLEWINESKELNSKEWILVSEGNGKQHSLSSRNLTIPQKYQRRFLSLDDSPEETFSYLFHFSPNENIDYSEKISALLFSSIGLRWRIYLNGTLIDDTLGNDYNTSRYNYLVPFDTNLLNQESNRILIQIEGPRSNYSTGFYRSSPYLFGDFFEIENIRSETLAKALITLYLALALFHLLIYFRKPTALHNLYYSIFSFLLALFILTRTALIAQYIVDSSISFRIQAFCFFGITLFGLLFFQALFQRKPSNVEIILIPLNICLIIASLIFSESWISDVYNVYKFFLPAITFYILFWIVGSEFMNDLIRKVAVRDKDKDNIAPVRLFIKTLIDTVSGNLFLGILAFSVFLIIDIVDMLFLFRGIFLSQYGLGLFVVAIAYALSNRYIKLSDHNNELNSELVNKLKELEYSDQKYKFIVDGTTDLLFILGSDYEIRSMNNAAKKYFGVRPESLIGKSFMNLLYTTPKDYLIIQQLVDENFRVLDRPGKQIQFRTRIRTSRMQEPIEFSFRIESVDAGDHLEFIGKGTSSLDGSLSTHIIVESQTYQIENYILLAEELSQRLVRVLKKKLPNHKIDSIRTGLREILVNSIEHGNLNITFEEKSQHLSKGDYLQLISNRQKDPVYGNRKVIVKYDLTDSFVSYHITDEGNGFDYKELMMKAFANQSLGREHGRGIMLAENIFDIVEFQGSGNSVFLKLAF
jgi:PAS domain-containing protein/anti-sigma regulatory factor (Ser/Thr protein kinase)